jgi:hypothetical protein
MWRDTSTLDQCSNSWHCVRASDGQADWMAERTLERSNVQRKDKCDAWGSVVATTGVCTQSVPRLAVCPMYGTPQHMIKYDGQAGIAVTLLTCIQALFASNFDWNISYPH